MSTSRARLTVLAGPVDRAAVAAQGMSLVRTAEGWRFQTMVAGGWSAQL